jgi:N-acetylglucosaminyldiphosphoundecaprenol N-acetyl-beta-D-mannosaminyltransferase
MIEILGVPFYTKTIDAVVKEVIDGCGTDHFPKNYCISASGAHGLVEAAKNPDFKVVLNNFHLNLPDGMPTVWIGRLKGAKEMQRCYGPDFFMKMIKSSATLPINHYFCGGKEGIAEQLKHTSINRFGNSNVVGTFYPPFREMADLEMKELGDTINATKANIVWIGMSCPKQEQFAYRLATYTNVHFLVAVGAAFDFHTGQVKQAPKWMREVGLEWFFRLLMEPKRLFPRYFEVVPQFIWLNFKEFINYIGIKLKPKKFGN